MTDSKYLKMHQDMLQIAEKEGLHIIAGKVPYLELVREKTYRAQKVSYIQDCEFSRLGESFQEQLDDGIYEIKVGEKAITVRRNDILAGSPSDIMKYPKTKPVASMVFRRIDDRDEEMAGHAYMGSIIYTPSDVEGFMTEVYGQMPGEDDEINEYTIFDERLDYRNVVREAEKRGFFTEEKKKRDKEFRDWIKNSKRDVIKAYREYQEELLATEIE